MNRKEFLCSIIKEIGQFQLKHFQTSIDIKQKSSDMDLVSFVDINSQKLFEDKLQQLFPEDDVLGEETYDKDKKYDTSSLWIIDPLDGTLSFLRGFKEWGPMVAYVKDGVIQFSALYVPYNDELYLADETGAYCNDSKISVSDVSELQKSVVEVKPVEMNVLYPHVGVSIYGYGAIAHFPNIATGRTDGYCNVKNSTRPWDLIPGIFLVRQAGGRVTNTSGRDLGLFESHYIASNGKVHDELLAIYAKL